MENNHVVDDKSDLTNEIPVVFAHNPKSNVRPEALAKTFLLSFLEVNKELIQ